MNVTNFSQTQLANIMSIAGMLTMALNWFGVILDQNQVAYIIAGVWILGWNGYNFYQRYKKGDVNLLGARI